MPDLTTGLTTTPMLEEAPPHFRVTWIAWDSPFRSTDLRVGDRILAVNGTRITCPDDSRERSRFIDRSVGGTNESQGWSASGLTSGSSIALTVRRRARPVGWTTLTLTAPLGETTGYRDANNRIVYGAGGPDTMSSDGFSQSWTGWYDDRMVPAIRRALDTEQQTSTFVTRFEWKQLAEQEERVAYAVDHYAGPWSRALKADFDTALAECEGMHVVLPPGALDFRRRGEELAAETRAKAQAAWESAKASTAGESIVPFPALNPVRGDVRPVVGKVVVLPPIGNSQWVSEAGHGWFAIGSANDGWYFIDAEGGAAQAMLRSRQRFGRIVDPNVRAEFEFIARITDDSRLVMVGGERAYFGLLADPLAALVGGTMFVDLRNRTGDQVPFAGEDAYVDTDPTLPPADAPPAAVLSAMIDAVKVGDIALWRALHADWSVERNDDGRRVIYPHTNPPNDSNFEESKRSMKGRVLDARVVWVDDPTVVADGSRFRGALHIEEVLAEIEHVGSFDGDIRTFADVTVRRRWRLQRVDGGPWRIAGAQPI